MAILDRILRAGDGKKVKALADIVPDINAYAAQMSAMSDDELRGKTGEFKSRLDRGETLEDLLIESFAVVREAATRVIGQRHYDVQLMGGAALHAGWVAEMKTGEGKTLVSTLPAYLNGLSGKGVHQITTNDYLAQRDAEWMGQIHRWLGLSVGLVIAGRRSSSVEKRADYAADITFGTNNEFGFDYLRDNMAGTLDEKVQRGFNFAIVDEVDSILIDESRTPLIISGRVADAAKLYYRFASIVRTMVRDVDYDVEEDKRIVVPTETGIEKVEKQLGIDNLYDEVQQNFVHQLQVALKASVLYHRDKDYIIQDGEIKIVDEFTGRILEGRRWSEGIHQAVEAKEGVKIKEENQTLATITLQNYFRMYEKLSGMTGTAQTEAAELMNTYNLQVVPIPTNRAMVRVDQADLIYKSEVAKFEAVVQDLEERHAKGQPVLVGTISVEKSEQLSKKLKQRGIPHEVLNAKQHTREAVVVTQAGRLGAITVATNMAGRGVDILLGGNPDGLARQDVLKEGHSPETLLDEFALPVALEMMPPDFLTAREKAQQRYHELLKKYTEKCKIEGDQVRALGGLYVLGTERHERAQTTVEQRNGEVRKNVLKYDEVMNQQRKVIYQRRDQILQGLDLKAAAMEYLAEAVDALIEAHCVAEVDDEWDVTGLALELVTYWPTKIVAANLASCNSTDEMYDLVMADASGFYAQREIEMGESVMREVERQVMLRIIDQRWREHLEEMDYLQEGINLRAVGQKDPLIEWQREGFEMFGTLMKGIAQDFVKYVMHVQVVNDSSPSSALRNIQQTSDENVDDKPAAISKNNSSTGVFGAPDWSKTPRNSPCPCGSGKKYKMCHGRAN